MGGRTQETKRRENILVAILLCGAIPFLIYSKHPWVWVMLKVYGMTGVAFCYIFFIQERKPWGKKWFWKAMSCMIPMHFVFMAVFIYLNFKWISIQIPPMLSYFIVFIFSMVEVVFLVELLDKFRPDPDATPDSSATTAG